MPGNGADSHCDERILWSQVHGSGPGLLAGARFEAAPHVSCGGQGDGTDTAQVQSEKGSILERKVGCVCSLAYLDWYGGQGGRSCKSFLAIILRDI